MEVIVVVNQITVGLLLYLSARDICNRRISLGPRPQQDDFNLVYHAVIDAVEEYNELWEYEVEQQKQEVQEKLVLEKRKKVNAFKAVNRKWSNGKVVEYDATVTIPKKEKSSAFMSEAETKEEQILKQKSELASIFVELNPEGEV